MGPICHATLLLTMGDFPAFMKSPLNRIAAASQFTEGIEGYVFDGVDGSQVAFWRCDHDRVSQLHAHDFDEYTLVIEGRCIVNAGGKCIELRAGQELVVPRGTPQTMQVFAGTRTMHVFGGKRARRQHETP